MSCTGHMCIDTARWLDPRVADGWSAGPVGSNFRKLYLEKKYDAAKALLGCEMSEGDPRSTRVPLACPPSRSRGAGRGLVSGAV